jgi:hypothetical protein
MLKNRITNSLLAIIATLLLFNLGVMLSQNAHAYGKTQYKVVEVYTNKYQQTFDAMVADGWEYAGSAGPILIFKK